MARTVRSLDSISDRCRRCGRRVDVRPVAGGANVECPNHGSYFVEVQDAPKIWFANAAEANAEARAADLYGGFTD